MSKLLLKFKNKVLQVVDFDDLDEAVLGREPSCDLRVDSIRCAPRHARILHLSSGKTIMQPLDEERFPLVVNDRKQQGEYHLRHGDVLTFGDYTIEFAESTILYKPASEEEDSEDKRLWSVKIASSMPATIQVLSGSKMGRVIKLTRDSTVLGGEKPSACIERQSDGYWLSVLENHKRPVELNGSALQQREQLSAGDIIKIGNLHFEFQCE